MRLVQPFAALDWLARPRSRPGVWFDIAEEPVNRRHALPTLVLLAMLICLVGCGGMESSGVDPVVPETRLPFPDTPDKLMQNFQTTYETMSFAELTAMMDTDFRTILQHTTIDRFPTVGPTLDVPEETRIHERMFSGQSVVDPLGSTVPGIGTIQFQTFVRRGEWAVSPPGDAIPNTTNALFDVVFLLDRGQAYSTLKVQGAIRFYVTDHDSTVNGVTRPYYRMLGQVDLTSSQFGKGTESVAWGTVKASYR